MRILLVDDDPVLIQALGNTLREDGHFVIQASGGEAGITAFQDSLKGEAPFDVVITDLGMNPLDGRAVTLAVKNASPATPVILLTGWGQWFETPGSLPLPVDCVLAKPPKLRELREALAQCQEKRKGN